MKKLLLFLLLTYSLLTQAQDKKKLIHFMLAGGGSSVPSGDSGYGSGNAITTSLPIDRVNVVYDTETKNFTLNVPTDYYCSWIIREAWTQTAVTSGTGLSGSFTGNFDQEDESGFGSLQEGVKFYDLTVTATHDGNTFSRTFKRHFAVYTESFTRAEADEIWDLSSMGLTKDGGGTNRPGYKVWIENDYTGSGYLNMYRWRSEDPENPIRFFIDPAGASMTTSNAYVIRVNEECRNIIIDGSGDSDLYGFVGTQSGGTFAQAMIIEPVGGSTTVGNEGQNVTISGLKFVGNNTTGAGINVNFTNASRADFNYDNYEYQNLHIFNTEVEDVNDEGYYLGWFNDSESGGYAHPKTVNSVFCYNRAINSGADGFQIGSWTDSEIHNNYAEDSGNNNNSSHRNMMQLIAPQNVYVYNNYLNNIADNTSNSLNLATGRGGGNVYLWSNVFDNRNTAAHNNIFVNIQENEYDDVIESFIYNNTFISDIENAIEIWDATEGVNTYFNPLYLVDNAILSVNDANEVVYVNTPTTTYYTVDNLFSQTSSSFGFTDYATGDLKPASLDAALFAARTSFTKAHPNANQDIEGYTFVEDIHGAYSGVELQIFETLPDVAPPVLSGFIINDANADRVYFESDEIITATTFTGFTLADPSKTITAITINAGQLTGHYFTVSAEYDETDDPTIEYSSGSNLVDAFGNALASFGATSITNDVLGDDAIAPTISAFTINDSNPDRLYFESSEVITATTYGGFTIDRIVGTTVTVTGVTINAGQLTGHYFTLSENVESIDYLARLAYSGSGSNLQDASTNVLASFAATLITNSVAYEDRIFVNCTSFSANLVGGTVWNDADFATAGVQTKIANLDDITNTATGYSFGISNAFNGLQGAANAAAGVYISEANALVRGLEVYQAGDASGTVRFSGLPVGRAFHLIYLLKNTLGTGSGNVNVNGAGAVTYTTGTHEKKVSGTVDGSGNIDFVMTQTTAVTAATVVAFLLDIDN